MSAIYSGWLQHQRYAPHPHAFRYPVKQLLLDLDEVDTLFRDRWLWSVDRRNVAEFRRSDFLGDPQQPLIEAVRDRVQVATGARPAGPVRLLTHLRYAGYIFNPVSFYYCYGADGERLEAVLAQITNTPWNERHEYVLPVAAATARGNGWSWDFDKQFHVSPFLPMDCRYRWQYTEPGDTLQVGMQVWRGAEHQFDAHLRMKRRPLDARGLAGLLLTHPLMTAQVIGAIHWQALRLWLKGSPVYAHPTPASREVSR